MFEGHPEGASVPRGAPRGNVKVKSPAEIETWRSNGGVRGGLKRYFRVRKDNGKQRLTRTLKPSIFAKRTALRSGQEVR